MNEDEPLISPPPRDRSNLLGWIVLGYAAVLVCYIVFDMLVMSAADRYYQVTMPLVVAGLAWLGIAGCWLVPRVIHIPDYDETLYHDRIELHRDGITYRTIYLSQVLSWNSRMDEDSSTPDVVLLLGDGSRYSVRTNSEAFQYRLGQLGLRQDWDIPAQTWWESLRGLLAMLGIGAAIWLLVMLPAEMRDSYKGKGLQTVSLVLRMHPDVTSNDDDDRMMHFAAIGLDDFTFQTTDTRALDICRTDPDAYQRGDTLHARMLRYDYEVKLAHTRPSTWWDRHVGWGVIELVGVE